MAAPRHLTNAPIVEALVDFRVPLNPSINESAFSDLQLALAERFPSADPKKHREARIKLGENGLLETNVEELGFYGLWLTSDDGRHVLQFRPDGFTFSRLKPYTSWAEIRQLAFSYWSQYAAVTRPGSVVRVALRYINRLHIPLRRGGDFSQYLVAAPIVPQALPQLVSHFMTRIVLHEPKEDLQANVTQSLEYGTDTSMQVLFDIDVYKQHDFSTDVNELGRVFEALHDFKNAIFFESLTETALEAFA